jgi:hypothetical protein
LQNYSSQGGLISRWSHGIDENLENAKSPTTRAKFIADVIYIGEQLIGGIIDTGDKSISGVMELTKIWDKACQRHRQYLSPVTTTPAIIYRRCRLHQ